MEKYNFCKMIGKNALKILRNRFGVDIQNLDVSENFKDQKYIKAEMQNDVFLFFNKTSLIGMLVGTEYNKDYPEFNRAYIPEFDSYSSSKNKLKRNRKNYDLFATDIIRIKRSDMTLTRKFNTGKTSFNPRYQLAKRLEKYKTTKHANISHEKIIDMSKEISIFLSNNLFNQLPTEYRNIKWYSINNFIELLEAFAKDVNDYIYNYKYVESYFQKNSNLLDYNKNYHLQDYNKSKLEIINWYNKLIK